MHMEKKDSIYRETSRTILIPNNPPAFYWYRNFIPKILIFLMKYFFLHPNCEVEDTNLSSILS